MHNGAFCDIAAVSYWEQNARWQQLWTERCDYHAPILSMLLDVIRPHWRVLDIGAGNGILSFPLAAIGCAVTALEPCAAMRRYFFREAGIRKIGHVRMDDRPWDSASAGDYSGCDLVIACNSLHVCSGGAVEAFRSIIGARPRNIFVVAETDTAELRACAIESGYALKSMSERERHSPYVYNSLAEADEHWSVAFSSGARKMDKSEFRSSLRPWLGRWYLDETVNMSVLWWTDGDGRSGNFTGDFIPV